MGLKLFALLISGVFLALSALVLGVEQLYLMSVAMFAATVLAYLISYWSPRSLSCSRVIRDRVEKDQPVQVELTLTNRGRWPRFFLEGHDQLPEWLESTDNQFFVPVLRPGGSVRIVYHAVGRKRGAYRVGPLMVRASDPGGIFERSLPLVGKGEALIYPSSLPVSGQLLGALQPFGTSSRPQVSRAGEGLDFYGIRDYRPGDDPRRIHWKSTSRLGRLAVTDFEHTFMPNIMVVLDSREGTEFGQGVETTLEHAIKLAASIIQLALRRDSGASLAVEKAGRLLVIQIHRQEGLAEAMEALARVRADGILSLGGLIEQAAGEARKVGSLTLLTCQQDPDLPVWLAPLLEVGVAVNVLLLDRPSFSGEAGQASDASMLIERLRWMGAQADLVMPWGDPTLPERRSLGVG